jgi:SOS-response transcriptional repressor LexA
MAEVSIWEGDLLVVDRSRTPRDGDVVVTGSNGAFSLKRLTHDTAASEPEIQRVNGRESKRSGGCQKP